MFGLNKPPITSGGYTLDYTFIAECRNGDIIKQSPLDTPKFAEKGSSFSEVANKHLRKFSLVGKGHIFSLDLLDGHLEIDGRKLYPPQEVLPGAKLELIYARTVDRNITMQHTLSDKKVLQTVLQPVVMPKVKYILGWQYNLLGKNYKWEMGIE